MTWIDQLSTKVLDTFGLKGVIDAPDETFAAYRDRLVELARQSGNSDTTDRSIPEARRPLPPPAARQLGVAALAPVDPSPESQPQDVVPSLPGDATALRDGDTVPAWVSSSAEPAPEAPAASGYGTFAVLRPKVATEKTQRVSVRSIPKSAQSRTDDAEERVRVRATKSNSLQLVRTEAGFVVPPEPVPLRLPDLVLPPAPAEVAP